MACPFLPSLLPFLYQQPVVSRPCFIPPKDEGSMVCPGWIDSLIPSSSIPHIHRFRSPGTGACPWAAPALQQGLNYRTEESLGWKRAWSDGGIFFFPSPTGSLLHPARVRGPASRHPPHHGGGLTASPRPSTRPRWPRPAPTAWPWAWSLAPPWQCQQVRRGPFPCSESWIKNSLCIQRAASAFIPSSPAGFACWLLRLCRRKSSNLPQILI